MLEATTVMVERVEMVLLLMYNGTRSSMHSDCITKFYAILIPIATTSSEMREVISDMEAYAPRPHRKGNNGGRWESCIELSWKCLTFTSFLDCH